MACPAKLARGERSRAVRFWFFSRFSVSLVRVLFTFTRCVPSMLVLPPMCEGRTVIVVYLLLALIGVGVGCGASGGLDSSPPGPADPEPAVDRNVEQDTQGAPVGSIPAQGVLDNDAGAGYVAPEAPAPGVVEGVVLSVRKDEVKVEIAEEFPIPPHFAIGVLRVAVQGKQKGGADALWSDAARVYVDSAHSVTGPKIAGSSVPRETQLFVYFGILEKLAGYKKGGARVLKKGVRVRFEQVSGKFHGYPL